MAGMLLPYGVPRADRYPDTIYSYFIKQYPKTFAVEIPGPFKPLNGLIHQPMGNFPGLFQTQSSRQSCQTVWFLYVLGSKLPLFFYGRDGHQVSNPV